MRPLSPDAGWSLEGSVPFMKRLPFSPLTSGSARESALKAAHDGGRIHVVRGKRAHVSSCNSQAHTASLSIELEAHVLAYNLERIRPGIKIGHPKVPDYRTMVPPTRIELVSQP